MWCSRVQIGLINVSDACSSQLKAFIPLNLVGDSSNQPVAQAKENARLTYIRDIGAQLQQLPQ